MAYCEVNFKTKKALKAALAEGKRLGAYQPGPFGPSVPANGRIFLEGPWYPEPHRWYAEAVMRDGVIVSVK